MGLTDKAMAKTRAIQEKAVAGQPSADAPLLTSPPRPGAVRPWAKIRYTITRTVPVQAETLRAHRIINGNMAAPVLEEYKILRTQILQRTQAEQQNTLMITGPSAGEGKTLTAINLAVSLAQELNRTVLLVDADLRSPSVHKNFGLPEGPGLVEYLLGRVTLPELLVHPEGFDKLVLLPGGPAGAGAVELLGSPMMADLVKELKNYYPDRYVLFDLPPVLAFADSLAFAPLVDGLILVVEAGRTSREDIQKCLELLKDYPILGFVLNKVATKNHGYYDYYGKKQ